MIQSYKNILTTKLLNPTVSSCVGAEAKQPSSVELTLYISLSKKPSAHCLIYKNVEHIL